MSIIYENGDIVNGNYEIFCQQVNCQRKMGAGLAKQIREKYPEVYNAYMIATPKLGQITINLTSDNRHCVNIYAQFSYGRDKRHTNYIAFATALEELASKLSIYPSSYKVAFPYGIGCGLGGGDWNVIKKLIEDFSERITQDVYIVKIN